MVGDAMVKLANDLMNQCAKDGVERVTLVIVRDCDVPWWTMSAKDYEGYTVSVTSWKGEDE